MTNFSNIATDVLHSIVAAYTASYGRHLTEEEMIDCAKTIEAIKREIESRKAVMQQMRETDNDSDMYAGSAWMREKYKENQTSFTFYPKKTN